MKYLYNKIYEAINTGIQKALVLDDEDDISMNYQHKKIINNSNAIFYYVDDLLNEADNEYNYEQIINYYNETGYTYKVKDFTELRNIFDKIKNFKNVSFEWIENLKDYISIVLEDNSEINFYENPGMFPLFLKIANDDILGTENEILIYLHKNHYIPKSEMTYRWQTKEVQIQPNEYLIDNKNIANKDYAGYKNCLMIHDIVSKDPDTYGNVPAIEYCLNQKVNGYQGYLPAMGQLRLMSDNIDMINYIFKQLGLIKIKDLNTCFWWSSTENNNDCSWLRYYGNTNYVGNKVYDLRIFPLFTIKKN
ncbi:MAG: hypothetical protein [Wendovervirus sonii]|uniref:DUF1566 domain-containing protein n=1 Tax=phage Lak_Megaphage_Sonny TaxID=3109229 RepID=A0ABZ0Z2P4_9CAUD|nr:MAG: hypothetical protein [phage Lak_Megaphage_Sonny]